MSKPKVTKKELEQALRHWQWQACCNSNHLKPWISIPGLVVHLDQNEPESIPFALDVLDKAVTDLRVRLILGDKTAKAISESQSAHNPPTQ